MPAVCKFYLKGYCRYGSSCRFEHPGENDYNDYSQGNYGTTNFSFKTALNETLPTSPQINTFTSSSNSNFNSYTNHKTTGFSFARALETTAGPQHSSFGHHDVDMSEGFSSNRTHQQLNSIFSQTYNNLVQQQQQQPNNIFGSNPFQQQQQQLQNFSQYQPQFNSLLGAQQSFGQSSSSLLQNTTNFSHHNQSDSKQTQNSTHTNLNELTEAEVKAFEADNFELHLIPIRPPPAILCS